MIQFEKSDGASKEIAYLQAAPKIETISDFATGIEKYLKTLLDPQFLVND